MLTATQNKTHVPTTPSSHTYHTLVSSSPLINFLYRCSSLHSLLSLLHKETRADAAIPYIFDPAQHKMLVEALRWRTA